MIVCSCGCKVEDFDETVHLSLKEYDEFDNPCVTSVVYCQKCAATIHPDYILTTPEEELDWMHNAPEIDNNTEEYNRLLDIERKWNWLCENVKEVPLNSKSFFSEFPDLRMKWELPFLLSTTCVNSHISFDDAVSLAMGEQNDE